MGIIMNDEHDTCRTQKIKKGSYFVLIIIIQKCTKMLYLTVIVSFFSKYNILCQINAFIMVEIFLMCV